MLDTFINKDILLFLYCLRLIPRNTVLEARVNHFMGHNIRSQTDWT